MLTHYYINKEWIISRTARRIYRTAATLSLALFLVLPFADSIPPSYGPLFRLFFFAGVLGTATTLIAMEYFLLGFDSSSAWKKAFWFG